MRGLLAFLVCMFVGFKNLYNCKSALYTTVTIMSANAVFCYCLQQLSTSLGEIYEHVIAPMDYTYLLTSVSPQKYLILTMNFIGVFYGFTRGNAWSQELADNLWRNNNKKSDQKKVSGDGLYAFLVWIVSMITVTVMDGALPNYLNAQLVPMLARFHTFIYPNAPELVGVEFYITNICHAWAITVQCGIYSLYPFELNWISSGKSAEERCNIIEKRWEYFLGFGLPFVIGARMMGFFEYYAAFLLTFPFVIAYASDADYEAGYNTKSSRIYTELEVFKRAQNITLGIFNIFGMKLNAKLESVATKKATKVAAVVAEASTPTRKSARSRSTSKGRKSTKKSKGD